jgi:hypothetical protein
MLASMLATVRALGLSMDRLTAVEIPHGYDWPPRLWPSLFDWPTSDYAWIALIGLASFGVTFAMVTRQRRGDAVLAFARTPRGPSRAEPKERFWYSLVDLFRFRCPTSSAARAQVWLDLKANGLPVLTLGVAFALVILVLSAVSGPVDAAWNADQLRTQSCANNDCFFVRVMPVMLTPLFLVTILSLGGNAFGIRRRQGRVSVSAFEATQAYGTAQLAIVKVLVKSVCVLTALIAIGISVWISLPLLGDAVFIKMWGVPLSSQRSAVNSAVTALTAAEQIALAIVAVVGVGLWVAWWSAVGALWTRYSRRLAIAALLLMLYALAVAVLALASWRGIGSEIPLTMILRATLWVAAAAIVLATAYLVWSAFAEQLMTIRHGWGVVALSTAFAAAWLTVLQAAGLSLTDMTASGAVAFVSPALLPLTISVLAPWSYSRVRHT